MAEHRNLTGAALHEPKGVENASAGQVYVADGNGSGAWKAATVVSYALQASLTDLATAGNRSAVAVPSSGTLTKVFVKPAIDVTATAATLTVYKNGTAQTPTMPVQLNNPATVSTLAFNIALAEADVIEFRVTTAAGSASAASVTAKIKV